MPTEAEHKYPPLPTVYNDDGNPVPEEEVRKLTHYAPVNPKTGHSTGITFTDRETEKSVEERAAWLGLTKNDYIQRHILSGEPVRITPATLRRQVRWLSKHLERIGDQITVDDREPDPALMNRWFERFSEIFNVPGRCKPSKRNSRTWPAKP